MTRLAGPAVLARGYRWLAVAGLLMSLAVALPPVEGYAREYAFVQALQFAIFAVAGPALLVLGVPRPAPQPDRPSPAGHPVARAAVLLPFIALVIAWRLPPVLSALVRYPVLTAAEMLTLLAAGSAVWIELIAAAPRHQPLPRPLRAAMAAVATWTIWAIAYISGMSGMGQARSSALVAPGGATDHQIAVGVLFAVPALCLAPVVYGILFGWLGERDDPDAELRAAALPGSTLANLGAPPRPPRGWRSS